MTRSFRATMVCQACGEEFSAEHPVLQWIRNNPRLDSKKYGLSITDIDLTIHQYKTHWDVVGERNVENIMDVEIKTYNKKIQYAQRDTLILRHQVFSRNNRNTFNINEGQGCYSQYNKIRDIDGKIISVRYFGCHLLTLSNNEIENSCLFWDHKAIDIPTLEQLIRFECDPFTLRKRSERRHHRNDVKQLKLTLIENK